MNLQLLLLMWAFYIYQIAYRKWRLEGDKIDNISIECYFYNYELLLSPYFYM